MAAIALPRLKLPRPPALNLGGLVKSPIVGLTAAAAVLAGAVVALVNLLGPAGGANHVSLPVTDGLHAAPAAWRSALKPHHGRAQVYADVIRLSERPVAPGAGVAPALPSAAPATAAAGPLAPAPIAGLFSPGPSGPLPIIAQDGRTPAQAYARPFQSNGRPRVALVVGGLGLNAVRTRQAIEGLRPEITLSFAVYAPGLQGWIDEARAHGHEVLIEAPMEPMDYPDNDPGPWTLLADSPPAETIKRLEWVLSRATGYFGVTNYLGGRFLTGDGAYNAFTGALRARGLAFIDDGAAARRGGGLPRASAERVVDDKLTGVTIDQQLAALEAGAQQHGQALGSAFAYPVTLEKVAHWAAAVEQRGYQLAPASAVMTKR